MLFRDNDLFDFVYSLGEEEKSVNRLLLLLQDKFLLSSRSR